MAQLFDNLNIEILKNGDPIENKTSSLLKSNGCTNFQIIPPETLKFCLYNQSKRSSIHFVIVDSIPSDDILQLCFKFSVPIINAKWVSESVESRKLVPIEPFQYFSNVLKNCQVYISRYSFNEQEYKFLRNLVLLLGGHVTYILSKRSVTHVLLKGNDKLGNDPIKQLLPILHNGEDEIHIVDELWLFDKYFSSEFSNTIINSVNGGEGTNGHDSVFNKPIFDGYQFLIDLQMDILLIDHLSNMIKSYGGTVLSHRDSIQTITDDNSDKRLIYLGEFHGNPLFNSVRTNANILKINLNWIFQCILKQEVEIFTDHDDDDNDLNNQMIYKIPTEKQKKLCSGMKICYTQFFGLQRFKIIDEIEMLGGIPTPNFNLDTDLLIVGVPRGLKYSFALKNDIPMVTPEWLDKTFESEIKQPFYQYIPRKKNKDVPLSVEDNVDNDMIITSSPSLIIEEPESSKEPATTDNISSQESAQPDLDKPKFHQELTKPNMKEEPLNKRRNEEKEEGEEKYDVSITKIQHLPKRSNKRQKTEDKARKILLKNGLEKIEPLYNIRCVTTQCLDELTSLDKEILKLIGIEIFDEINESNIKILNGVIAPRRLRTLKFLLSLSFEPLEYALKPQFITDILDTIKKGQNLSNKLSSLDLKKYYIPEVDISILQKTKLMSKVFSRGNITNINISSNMQGGTKTLKTILESHGIKDVNVLKKKFSIDDIVRNGNYSIETVENSGRIRNRIPQYILITDQQSQMKQFKTTLLKHDKETKDILIVEWNWCVQCIFSLDVSYDKYKSTILYYE